MRVFEVEEKVVVQAVHQRGGAEGTGKLGSDEWDHFTSVEAGEQPKGNGDGGIKVRTGYACGQVDGHRDPQPPDDANFPLSKACACHFKRSNTSHAEKNQQSSTKKLCDALAF